MGEPDNQGSGRDGSTKHGKTHRCGKQPHHTVKRYVKWCSKYEKPGAAGSIPWYLVKETGYSIHTHWLPVGAPTEDARYSAVMSIDERTARLCPAFTKRNVDATQSGVYNNPRFQTGAETARKWLRDGNLRVSKRQHSNHNTTKQEFPDSYFRSRQLVAVTFKSVYNSLRDIRNVYEWFVVLTQAVISLGFIGEQCNFFHGAITPHSIVFERLPGGLLNTVITDWEGVRTRDYDKKKRTLFMSVGVEENVRPQTEFDDFISLFYVHSYMLHFTRQHLIEPCDLVFANPLSRLKNICGHGYPSMTNQPSDPHNPTNPFVYFSRILCGIFETRYAYLSDVYRKELEVLVATDVEAWDDANNQTLIDVFVIASEMFLARLVQDIDPRPAVDPCSHPRIDRIKETFPNLLKQLEEFKTICENTTEQILCLYRTLVLRPGFYTDGLKYLYPIAPKSDDRSRMRAKYEKTSYYLPFGYSDERCGDPIPSPPKKRKKNYPEENVNEVTEDDCESNGSWCSSQSCTFKKGAADADLLVDIEREPDSRETLYFSWTEHSKKRPRDDNNSNSNSKKSRNS